MKGNYKYLFGPVPSRRLGKSLGVSPIPPKTCNYSCVYCQIGRTTHFTNIRQDFFPKEEIFSEINTFVESNNNFDYITFVGEGEPTLCKSLGWLIRSTKEITDKPVAVITNGALLYDSETRNDLLAADVILPTLDATTQELFKKINRPKKDLTIDKIIQGMQDFRSEFQGQIWMEIMLVEDLNDGPDNISNIKSTLDKLGCDRIYVNVPIRPPAENWVKIPDKKRVLEICNELNAYNIAHYESIQGFQISKDENIKDQILKITTRHPLRESQILAMFDLSSNDIIQLLNEMSKEGKLKRVIHNNQIFWLNANSRIKTK
ncbi:MAG: radical SAM protein [Asgard group archaeon]|nr:radical SAM protein [Asgard group archaeon]